MPAAATTPTPDPYDLPPSFWQRRAEPVAAVAAAGFTVLLAVLSFPPFKTPEFAYAMLVPGILWAYTAPRLKLFAWTMAGAQAVAWTIILGWLHHVTWGGLLVLGPLVGLWMGSWYLAAWWTLPRMVGRPTLTRLLAMLGLAAAWVLIEWTRTWLLGGFPWLPLAASQWERASILQIAAYTGAGGISFTLVGMNLGFAAYAHRLFREGATGLGKRSQEFFLAVFLLLVCLSIHVQEAFNRAAYQVPWAKVAFVQPYIPQSVKWDPAKAEGILEVLEKTTLAAASGGELGRADLVLWPEAVTPWAVRGDAGVKAFVESLSKRAYVPLLLGSIAVERRGEPGEQWFNGAFAVSPETGLQSDYYAKRQLVPFGEYVPFRAALGWLKKFVEVGDGDFSPGLDSAPLLVSVANTPTVFGPLVCYEDIFPSLARHSALAGAEVLAVLTNDAWYGEGGAAYQHAAHSVLRAVETRRPVLRCGNAGWSGWIDEFGTVRGVLTDEAGSVYFRGSKTVAVARDARWIGKTSFYVEHGDWFVGACALTLLLGLAAVKLAPPAVVVSEAAD